MNFHKFNTIYWQKQSAAWNIFYFWIQKYFLQHTRDKCSIVAFFLFKNLNMFRYLLNPLVLILFPFFSFFFFSFCRKISACRIIQKFEGNMRVSELCPTHKKKKKGRKSRVLSYESHFEKVFPLSTRLPLRTFRRVRGRRYRKNKIGGLLLRYYSMARIGKVSRADSGFLYNGPLPLCGFMRCKRPYVYLDTFFFRSDIQPSENEIPLYRPFYADNFPTLGFSAPSELAFRNSMAFRYRVIICSKNSEEFRPC